MYMHVKRNVKISKQELKRLTRAALQATPRRIVILDEPRGGFRGHVSFVAFFFVSWPLTMPAVWHGITGDEKTRGEGSSKT